jgi:hypothetical protein
MDAISENCSCVGVVVVFNVCVCCEEESWVVRGLAPLARKNFATGGQTKNAISSDGILKF